jgi:putative oxidoreductase
MADLSTTVAAPRSYSPVAAYRALLSLAERFPLSLVQLASRLAIAQMFWNSAHSKLASWPVTVQLFAFDVAAVLATVQLFVFPGHWAEHLLWPSLLLLLLARGAGVVSLDHAIKRFFPGKV